VRHEPGRVVRDLAVMLADGGDCLTDLGALRDQEVLFGPVASDATAYRCVERLDEEMLTRMRKARAAARARAWKLGQAPRRLILDIDATLLTAQVVGVMCPPALCGRGSGIEPGLTAERARPAT
jgi:hypothetical protein